MDLFITNSVYAYPRQAIESLKSLPLRNTSIGLGEKPRGVRERDSVLSLTAKYAVGEEVRPWIRAASKAGL